MGCSDFQIRDEISFEFLSLYKCITHLLKSFLVAVRIDRGHQMNSGLIHQVAHSRVAVFILSAEVLHEHQEKLSSQSLIAMKTCCVSKLRLS